MGCANIEENVQTVLATVHSKVRSASSHHPLPHGTMVHACLASGKRTVCILLVREEIQI